jgi:hypothetical protein
VFLYGLAVVFKHPVNQSNVNENTFAEFFFFFFQMVLVGRTNPSYLSCQFHELKTLFHDSY